MLLLVACAQSPSAVATSSPSTSAPPALPTTPAELAGEWFLTERYQDRTVIGKPCNADIGHLRLEDKDGHAVVAARRVLAVHLGDATNIVASAGSWSYSLGDSTPWTFSFLDPDHRLLRISGGPSDLVGPWVRAADVDAWELIRVPASRCGKPDSVVLPDGLATGWWRVLYTDGAWALAPEPGTLPTLELSATAIVQRSGRGDTSWPLLRVEPRADGVDLTVQDPAGGFRGARISTTRPPTPPGEPAGDRLNPPSAVPDAPTPLPEGARFISLPGQAPYTAGVWVPEATMRAMRR